MYVHGLSRQKCRNECCVLGIGVLSIDRQSGHQKAALTSGTSRALIDKAGTNKQHSLQGLHVHRSTKRTPTSSTHFRDLTCID
eukprot:1161538-Pelagomonas_calceolata.AAC.4